MSYSNRLATDMVVAAASAILNNDATLLRNSKRWVQEEVQFAFFPNGAPAEQNRWGDNPNTDTGASSSWTHAAGNWGAAIIVADMIARTGDTSLYTYTSSNGQFGTGGTSKSLQTTLLHEARLANGTLAECGIWYQ